MSLNKTATDPKFSEFEQDCPDLIPLNLNRSTTDPNSLEFEQGSPRPSSVELVLEQDCPDPVPPLQDCTLPSSPELEHKGCSTTQAAMELQGKSTVRPSAHVILRI